MAAKNAMEIFALLDKSNCRQCGEKTCLAFAGKVFLGERNIRLCPNLSAGDIRKIEGGEEEEKNVDGFREEYLLKLKRQVSELDFEEVAARTGCRYHDCRLTVRIMGKNFTVLKNCDFVTDLHTIHWLVVPLLEYILGCRGVAESGCWISFRELEGGKEKYPLFKKRSEDVMKNLADKYTDFFDDIIHMFDGKSVEREFQSDVSVVLYPLPMVPLMLCYWKAEEGLGSSLNLFFDKSADHNLGIDGLFLLCSGLALMFERLAEHHGF